MKIGTLLIWWISILILFIVWIAFIVFSYEQLNVNNNRFEKNICNNLYMNNNTSINNNNEIILRTTKCVYFNYEQNRYNIVVYSSWLLFGPVLGIIFYLIMDCIYGIKRMFNNEQEFEQNESIIPSRKMTSRKVATADYGYNHNTKNDH